MYQYLNNCVNWEDNDVHNTGGLCEMIDKSIDITRRTFLAQVNRSDLKEIESNLGYESHSSKGLTMAGDWHVSYFRSKLHGKRVYGFVHSAIEYVFSSPSNEDEDEITY